MNHVILDRIYQKKQVSLSRFNDGECAALLGDLNVVSRGKQDVTPQLRERLKWALKYRSEGYYIGFPCPECFPDYYEFIKYNLDGYKNKILAVSTTNSHYIDFKRELLYLTKSDNVCIVGQEFDLHKLHDYGIHNRGAFSKWDIMKVDSRNTNELTGKYLPKMLESNYDYYFLCAGAASRYWAAKLHEAGKSALDLGSIFMPEQRLQENWINAHKRPTPYSNEVQYCGICNY